jgi:hypothetical protein
LKEKSPKNIRSHHSQKRFRSRKWLLNGPVPTVTKFNPTIEEISGLVEWLESRLSEGVKPKEIAVFGRTEAVLHDRADAALEAAGLGSVACAQAQIAVRVAGSWIAARRPADARLGGSDKVKPPVYPYSPNSRALLRLPSRFTTTRLRLSNPSYTSPGC